MKIFEVRQIPKTELVIRIKDEEENLSHYTFQKATSQLESPVKIRTLRRDIARMKTALREMELKASGAAAEQSSKKK